MKVLVNCEESQKVCAAFIARGHYARSCDILDTRGDQQYHIKRDAIEVAYSFPWDMMIAHPPCDYLSNSGNKHLYKGMKKENGPDHERWKNMVNAADFFLKLLKAPIKKKALENPIMHGYGKLYIGRGQTQIIQPWQHGHKQMKATCLWLEGLPELEPSNVVGPPPTDPEERKKWASCHREPPGPNRKRNRSETYQGIADAFAEQWGQQP